MQQDFFLQLGKSISQQFKTPQDSSPVIDLAQLSSQDKIGSFNPIFNNDSLVFDALKSEKNEKVTTPAYHKSSEQSDSCFQLCNFPQSLNLNQFVNPFSNSNPTGSYLSLYAFSQLVNSIPDLSSFYNPSGNLLDQIYGSVVGGAEVSGSSFVQQLFSQARQIYKAYALQNQDGIPGVWYPSYATPVDWYDIKQTQRFQLVSFNESELQNTQQTQTQADELLVDKPLTWSSIDGSGKLKQQSLSPSTEIKSIQFKALRVNIYRPWFNFQLFSTSGWSLQGQQIGYCSQGEWQNNAGIFPLYVTGFLFGYDISLDVKWDADDQQILDKARSNQQDLALGPFIVNRSRQKRFLSSNNSSLKGDLLADSSSEKEFQVLGWFSQLVPLSPR